MIIIDPPPALPIPIYLIVNAIMAKLAKDKGTSTDDKTDAR